jgi:hypothetical protein
MLYSDACSEHHNSYVREKRNGGKPSIPQDVEDNNTPGYGHSRNTLPASMQHFDRTAFNLTGYFIQGIDHRQYLAAPSYPGMINLADLGASGTRAGPGYPLQFLSPPAAGLRDFRFYPLRFAVRCRLPPRNKTTFS